MPVRVLLMDIDDTLFDFRTSSYQALSLTFAAYGLPFTQEMWMRYEALDAAFWRQFERGEITKEFLYVERFRVFFAEYGLHAEPAAFNAAYFRALGEQRYFMPHCEQVLKRLHENYQIDIVTNGNAEIQTRRIANSGMQRYFDHVFISEQMGCKKPDKLFYDRVFAQIGEAFRSCAIMIGDSLSSDMQGGRNAGIPTCFYGKKEAADDRCDYVVEDLLELPPLLAALA